MQEIIKQIEEYLTYCEKVRGMSETTLDMKRNVLERFVKQSGLKRLEELDNQVFERWMAYQSDRRVSASSLNMYNAIIIAMVRYWRENGILILLNLALVRKLKETKTKRRYYTITEIKRVIAMSDVQTGLIIRIMFETGMRIAEVTRLRASDFCGRQIGFIGKGKKYREVYITEETEELLGRYVREYGVRDYLWGLYEYGGNGEAPTVNTVRNRLERVFRAAGFKDFYPHALRHSFATDLQMRGASVAEIKEMIGHANIATTERYLHGFDGRLKELFDKYR